MAQFKENSEYIGSPCVKICKYKKDFMDGNVCIGCFREQFEITNWVKMSNSEKQLVIKDTIEISMFISYKIINKYLFDTVKIFLNLV